MVFGVFAYEECVAVWFHVGKEIPWEDIVDAYGESRQENELICFHNRATVFRQTSGANI